jgi:hypothetical protein
VLHLRLASRLGAHRNQLISGISLPFLVPGFWHMFLVRCSVYDPTPWLLMDLFLKAARVLIVPQYSESLC